MRKFLAALLVLLLLFGVGGGLLGYLAIKGEASECPTVKETGRTSDQIGDALDSKGVVEITNGDATSIGRSYVKSAVDDLRVCFDAKGGHASGKIALGSVKIPFYATAASADLTGASPVVKGLDFQIGGLPSWIVDMASSRVTGLIDNYMAGIKLKKKYLHQFGDGVVTVRTAS